MNTDWLSHKHRLNKKGLNLIIKYKDPTDARKVILQLSNEGLSLVRSLKKIIFE